MSELIEIHEDLLLDKKEINNSSTSSQNTRTFTGDRSEERELLKGMGFEESLIDTIYKNMNPVDIQEAIDFLNKNERGQFTHSFLVNENNVCTICGKGRNDHESDLIFIGDDDIDVEDDDNGRDSLNLLDDILINRLSNSHRFRAYEDTYRNSLGKEKKDEEDKLNQNKDGIECGICGEVIENSSKIYLKCRHYFCNDCWMDYLKEKITNANVSKILCMQHGCATILDEKFIKKILAGNQDLIDKYDKFSQRKKMLEQSDKIKFCPIPDCEGYAEKKGKNKYVKCNFGHEFCFQCGGKPHGKKKCEDIMDKEFEEWRSKRIVKRCPCCRMWTEKNEGCNHMTCVECKFQWCWLCQKPYSYNHFSEGSCNGLQFYKETDEKKIKAKLEENRKKYPGPSKLWIFFLTFLKCLGYMFIVFYIHWGNKWAEKLEVYACPILVFFFLAYLPIFISFEILFVTCTIIGTIPLLIYQPYYRRLKFYIINRLYQC